MTQEHFDRAEVEDAIDTAHELHTDISRLKRLGIVTSEEDRDAKAHLEQVTETLEEKLAEDSDEGDTTVR